MSIVSFGSKSNPEWQQIQDEVTRHLVELIRIDTSNPPGNEGSALEYIADVLSEAGIDSRVLEMANGRPNLVARVKGSGAEKPLLLFGHIDVVPAGRAGWTYEPFSGTVADGFVWGRGAVDMKHIVAAMLTAVVRARRVGLALQRDLIFAVTSDEESAGESGAAWLFREHPELVSCAVAVTESAPTFRYRDTDYFLIEVGQKGWLTVDLVRRSAAGHSSLPSPDNCLFNAGAVLNALSRERFPHHATNSAQLFIRSLAETQPEPERSNLLSLLRPQCFREALDALTCDARTKTHLEAVLHSHATPTMISGGESTWAIPNRVDIRLAGRVLPGQALEEWLEELEGVIGPLGDHSLSDFDPGVEMPSDSQLFSVLAEIVRHHNPDARILPALSTAGGDARHPLLAGAECLGFFPIAPEPGVPDLMELAHGRDERISIENLVRCVRYAWDVICATNGLPLEAV